MAQRDYVRCNSQATPLRRKKSLLGSSQKKKCSFFAASSAVVTIAAAVLVAFVCSLYFITYKKKEDTGPLQDRQLIGNGLPPKPEYRWRYIKELESRQPGVCPPSAPFGKSEVKSTDQLTDEQGQLLVRMQAELPQQRTQLIKLPWNEQTLEGRQQIGTVQNQPTRQPLHDEQTVSSQRPKTQQVAPLVRASVPTMIKVEKKDDYLWLVQCGVFKGEEQAEIVHAQLAFEGFDSSVTNNNGWTRVVIGPIKDKNIADATVFRLKVTGHTNCIRLATGG